MFGIGSTELLIIFVVALLVLGPKSLPGIAKTLGKVVKEFRKVSTEFQRTINLEVANEEHEQRKKEVDEEFAAKRANAAKIAEERAEQDRLAREKAAAERSANGAEISTAQNKNEASNATEATSLVNNNIENTTGVPNIADKNDAVSAEEKQLDPNSPLMQAVAKAEAEANTVSSPATPPTVNAEKTIETIAENSEAKIGEKVKA